jgi:hypothetical protein
MVGLRGVAGEVQAAGCVGTSATSSPSLPFFSAVLANAISADAASSSNTFFTVCCLGSSSGLIDMFISLLVMYCCFTVLVILRRCVDDMNKKKSKQANGYHTTVSLDRTESYSPVNQKLIIVRFLNDVQVFNEEVAVLNLFGYFLLKNYGRMKREERKIER